MEVSSPIRSPKRRRLDRHRTLWKNDWLARKEERRQWHRIMKKQRSKKHMLQNLTGICNDDEELSHTAVSNDATASDEEAVAPVDWVCIETSPPPQPRGWFSWLSGWWY